MKIKRLWTGMASFCVATSLLATVLTSCSAATIDEDLIVDIDDEGNLIGSNEYGISVTYKDAIKMALTRSSTWDEFKEALAEEIVYHWFEDRASNDDGETKNEQFMSDLKTIKDSVDDSYDDTVQSCKDKYGSSYKFYLQNQFLSPAGGTEESYKHAKIVQEVKAKFISYVWESNYFGYCKDWNGQHNVVYPRTFESNAKSNISEELLNNPKSWKDLGFYAYAKSSYNPHQNPTTYDTIDTDLMASYPDGDYASIQNYVFDRWFETEKPFFSAASLFKYTNPIQSTGLDQIYNKMYTGISLPDTANEAFPFFGGNKTEERGVGTKAYFNWYNDLIKGKYLTEFYGDNEEILPSNGTVSIPHKSHTDDSQTLLLSYATKMIGGSEGALYVPYASAAADLYLKMLFEQNKNSDYVPNTKMNFIKAQRIKESLAGLEELDCGDETKALILNNFFFTEKDGNYNAEGKWVPADDSNIGNLNTFIDLENLYEGFYDIPGESKGYHCRLFSAPINEGAFEFFYGKPSQDGEQPGIKFITNAVEVDDLTAFKYGSYGHYNEAQPWILELNESGMHAQTIDGYSYIQNKIEGLVPYADTTTKERAKSVLKYRLMQKKCSIGPHESISGDVFGSAGELAKYFENNFANIILELALNFDNPDSYIFRPIAEYKTWPVSTKDNAFLYKIATAENFNIEHLSQYLQKTIEYDERKKVVDAIAAANQKVYAYHAEQVKNAQFSYKYKKIYNNGLTCPICYSTVPHEWFETDYYDSAWKMHDYRCLYQAIYFQWDNEPTIPSIRDYSTWGLVTLTNWILSTRTNAFLNDALSAGVNDLANPFSPQIKKSKDVKSNRFWYKSAIVDKTIYSCMGDSEGLVNKIKYDSAYEYISLQAQKTPTSDFINKINRPEFSGPIISTFYKNNVLSGDVNYADLVDKDGESNMTYFDNIYQAYTMKLLNQLIVNGDYSTLLTNESIFTATLCYLMGDLNGDTPFANFYKILNSKIAEDEFAYIGYLNKINIQLQGATSEYTKATKYIDGSDLRYSWSPNVDNIYDQVGYSTGNTPHEDIENSRVASDTYWNIIRKTFKVDQAGGDPTTYDKILAGFTGLQTETINSLPAPVQEALFPSATSTGVGGHAAGSIDLSTATATGQTRFDSNTGAWFAFAGVNEIDGTRITFDDVIDPDDSTKVIKSSDFKTGVDGEGNPVDTSICLRLAKKMCNYTSIDDLRSLAKELGEAYSGTSLYRDIGEGEIKYVDINKMKYAMISQLPRIGSDGSLVDGNGYLKSFQRLSNVEVHETGVDMDDSKNYCFNDGTSDDGFNILITQISKADIAEQKLAPKWVGGTMDSHWEQGDSPITPQEFFFMLCQSACDTSVQSLAITEIVKEIFGSDKLKVGDATLYNIFDSSWIKNWIKKPMGE